MARKFELDSSIAKDIKAVASDSFVDSIKMISIENVKPANENFFSMSDIEILAEDIERQGLKHNLVVSEDKDERGTYWLKSGHRRFAAIKFLLQDNRLTNKTVPCLVDGIKTRAENMLDLIMLNATTRVMTDAEILQQYNILEKTYKELEAEGKKIKGSLRERIAEALQVSPAQVSKIEKVNRYAVNEIKEAVSSGNMSISTANEVSKLSSEEQKELVSNNSPEQIKHKEVKKIIEKNAENKNDFEEKKILHDYILQGIDSHILQEIYFYFLKDNNVANRTSFMIEKLSANTYQGHSLHYNSEVKYCNATPTKFQIKLSNGNEVQYTYSQIARVINDLISNKEIFFKTNIETNKKIQNNIEENFSPKEEKVSEKEEKISDIFSKNISLSYNEINALKLYLPSLLNELEENDFENYEVIQKIINKL